MNEILEKQSKFFDFVSNSIVKNHRLSHAYLLETNGNSNYMSIVKEFIKMILCLDHEEDSSFICHAIDSDNYPDLKIIKPDGYWIKKEQLLQLEQQYLKKSMLDNKLVYIIDSAEFLNDSSANTILKFLEEPPEGIVAILIANNRFHVIDTIVSRCQVLSLSMNEYKTEYDDIILNFIKDLSSSKELLIHFDYYLKNIFADKNSISSNLEIIEFLLSQKLRSNILEDSSILSFIDLDFDTAVISKILSIIEREKTKIQYNLNIKLWFHNFIVELMEVISSV